MSDPLSVAGTAVGITSLGIQVCQGLIKYLRAVRGRKEEIAEGVGEVDRVVSLLCSLNNLIPRVGSTNERVQLRDCLKSCDGELKRVQTLLSELNSVQQSNKATQRAANAMRSVTYPFQQAKLAALRQSLRSVLDDLTLIISILSLASEATIQDTINTMSQDLKAHASAQASGISNLQMQQHCHSVQLRSLQSTISGTLDDIIEQLHQTQLSMQDFDQRVDGKLTIIESGTQSIEASSQVTVAKLEEVTKALASQSRLMENMSVQIMSIQSPPNTDFATAEQNADLQEFSKALYKQSTDTRLRRNCRCAFNIPKSKTFFSFWNIEFELEQQEHHLPSCKLWGTKKGMKRTAKTTFPLKLAWLSARTTLACFQYATGTSHPSLSIRYTNIVPRSNSTVYRLCHAFVGDLHLTCSVNHFIRKIELLEREILTLYTCGQASPGDIDEYGKTHAEVVFDHVLLNWDTFLILHSNALTHTFLRCIRTLLQSYNRDKDHFSFSRSLATDQPAPNPFKYNTVNTKYLLSFMSQEACFSFSKPVLYEISETKPSDSLEAIIQDTSEISDIAKAILSRSIEYLRLCVAQDPKSVLESIHDINVLCLSAAWPEGLRCLLTTEAITLIDDSCEIGMFQITTPISRAIDLSQSESVSILLGAGCRLDLGDSRFSDQVAITIATHLSERRLRLLRFVQHQLGLFLDQTSVAFADSAAAEICAALDAAGVLLHPSLRVDSDYGSIYSQGRIPLDLFNCFWKKGFHHFKSHSIVGITPIGTSQIRLDRFFPWPNMEKPVEPMKWLVKKGFMQEKTRDPLDLGLNVNATGYHYLGAMIAQGLSPRRRWSGFYDRNCRTLDDLLAAQDHEDDCMCWCNAGNHGCSPLKLFLITCLRLIPATLSGDVYYQHVVLHHELFDTVSKGDRISQWIKGILRLLTFEALEMTHTCCSFDRIHEHDPSGLVPEKMMRDKGIFYHDPVSVSRIRSSTEEQSRAALLEGLMVRFTERLSLLDAGARAFEGFIFTHWRRCISQLYTPDPNAVADLMQHQTFQGLGLSHSVRTRVLPATLQRLLGNDFLLTDYLNGSPSLGELTSEVEEYKEPYCQWCNPDDESQSDVGSELDGEEEEEACVDDEYD